MGKDTKIMVKAYGAELDAARAKDMIDSPVSLQDVAEQLANGFVGAKITFIVHDEDKFDTLLRVPDVGKLTLSFDLDKKSALWANIHLEQEKNGAGMIFVANAMNASVALGMEKIESLAAMKGSYVWLEAGFTPKADDWNRVRTALLPKRLDAHEDQLEESTTHDIRNLLSNPDPQASRLLAGHPAKVELDGEQIKIGKVLLFDCGGLNVSMDTNNHEAMQQFKDYTTRHSFVQRERNRAENASEPNLSV